MVLMFRLLSPGLVDVHDLGGLLVVLLHGLVQVPDRLLQGVRPEVGVVLGHLQGGVAYQLLDRVKVGAALDQPTRERVTQVVEDKEIFCLSLSA